ncbi:MAG: hypothetical protein JNK82_42975 [Myxococcaceae bacterium]|nr:hypothetical protein [Myxococcaceae bacterium]
MRALMLAVTLWAGAALADEQCEKDCVETAKVCTDACAKKSKGNAAGCKIHCDKMIEECKKTCKDTQ